VNATYPELTEYERTREERGGTCTKHIVGVCGYWLAGYPLEFTVGRILCLPDGDDPKGVVQSS
jgi:hypothetical protein